MPNKTVLCVDDDIDDRELICEAIRMIDPSIDVIQADNGLFAMEMLHGLQERSALPDLIILDINMPVSGGREVVEELVQEKQLSSIPVYVFSTSAYPQDKNFFERYGITLYQKPDNFEMIKTVIAKMLATLDK